MAGIGFRLQNILRENSYRALAKAYLYSAVISSGPWLLSICGIFLIGILSSLLRACGCSVLFLQYSAGHFFLVYSTPNIERNW